MKERFYSLDLFKYFASLCIIVIHTEPLSSYNSFWNFFTVQIAARLAVPFFAVCTGFLMTRRILKVQEDKPARRERILGYWKRIIRIYCFWSFVYLLFSIPWWLQTGWFSAWAFVDYGIAAFRSASYYHLWYLLALIYAIPAFAVCLRILKKSIWFPLSTGLYGVYAIHYCYSMFLPGPIQKVFSVLSLFDGLTNGLFLILPFLLQGAILADDRIEFRIPYQIALVFSFLLLSMEAILLDRLGQNKVSYIVFTYPTALFFFQTVQHVKITKGTQVCRALGAASLLIYCFHPVIIEVLEENNVSPLLRFFVTVSVSTLAGMVWYLKKRKKERGRPCFH